MSEPDNKDSGESRSSDARAESKPRETQGNDNANVAANPPAGDSGGGENAAGGEQRQGANRPQGRHGRNRGRDRNRSSGGGGGGGSDRNQQRFQPPQDEEYDESKNGGGDGPLIDLNELKRKPAHLLLKMAEELGIQEGVARARKQDIIFLILKAHARAGGGVSVEGVLEILQDGFGFLRGPDESYLAGPDDIYVSPSQIRRFNLRTGDYIAGRVRHPKEGERYFALLRVDTINGEPPEASKNKVLFENLTPLFPRRMFHLER
ncbi:MAG TPA: Rho termination factor N-terminal domain-containing protein, partial [Rudaea sp.]|nr:Rho termination factor N-terminal domain-containing protein [Rudaea sp.]